MEVVPFEAELVRGEAVELGGHDGIPAASGGYLPTAVKLPARVLKAGGEFVVTRGTGFGAAQLETATTLDTHQVLHHMFLASCKCVRHR